MLYYLEKADLTECKNYGHGRYKLEVVEEGLLSLIENLDTSQSLLECKDCSYLQRLLST